MDIAEQAAKAQKEDDIDEDFQFYNTKNLTNSAPNYTVDDEEDLQVIFNLLFHTDKHSTDDVRICLSISRIKH